MTITQNNKLNIAYKRLSGLINSNPAFGTGNESIASNVQIGSSTIFGQAIDTDPAVAVTDGIAERKIFRIKSIASGFYKEDPETIDQPHVWKLQKFNGAEWVDFEGQLIGSSFGEGYYPKLYREFAGDNGTDFGASDGNLTSEVSKLSELNWTLDYFAGTLWFQNLTAETPTVEWVVVAYEYTGQYLDAVVGSGGSGGGNTGSGHRTITSTPMSGIPLKKTSLNIGNDELFLLDAGNYNIEIELPLASENENKKIKFKRIDDTSTDKFAYIHGNVVDTTIDGVVIFSAYQYIDDRGGTFQPYETGTSPPIDKGIHLHVQYETITLYCDGTKWHII